MFKQTNIAMNTFGDGVVKQAQKNLNTKGFAKQKGNRKKNASGKLSKSLGFDLKSNDKGIALEFTSGVNYARFVEEGRKKGQMPPAGAIDRWFVQKNLKNSRNSKGQFVKRKSAVFAIRKHIKENDIKPVPFFGYALDEEFKNLGDDLQTALVTDLEDIIFNNFQKNGSRG